MRPAVDRATTSRLSTTSITPPAWTQRTAALRRPGQRWKLPPVLWCYPARWCCWTCCLPRRTSRSYRTTPTRLSGRHREATTRHRRPRRRRRDGFGVVDRASDLPLSPYELIDHSNELTDGSSELTDRSSQVSEFRSTGAEARSRHLSARFAAHCSPRPEEEPARTLLPLYMQNHRKVPISSDYLPNRVHRRFGPCSKDRYSGSIPG